MTAARTHETADDAMNYVARFPGMPGYGACCVDDPSDPTWRKEVAKTLGDWIRRGATIEHVTREVAAAGMREYLAERERQKTTGSVPADSAQAGLF